MGKKEKSAEFNFQRIQTSKKMVALEDITPIATGPVGELMKIIHQLPSIYPNYFQQALNYLVITNPVIVEAYDLKSERKYWLISGMRTYQAFMGKYGRRYRIPVAVAEKIEQKDRDGMQLLDYINCYLYRQEGGVDSGYFLGELKDNKNIHDVGSSLLPCSTIEELASLVGLGRSALYDRISAARRYVVAQKESLNKRNVGISVKLLPPLGASGNLTTDVSNSVNGDK
ncbi:hypothetical protein [Rhodoferax sp. GW822-FHT02A01]|uniref:hypothetical protein n=1 Tax=Rhodoferax sp. GW822-FHT02A01 TaxID=3141537 RepID=UPI00315CAC1A